MTRDSYPCGNELTDDAIQASLTLTRCEKTFVWAVAAAWIAIAVGVFKLIF